MAKCVSCGVCVNEVLAFINHKIDVMDEQSLLQICSSAYKEVDVDEAKSVLLSIVPSRRPSRVRSGCISRKIQEIITTLKETDPDDLPTFVARDLNKLPPVTFDHVDVTVFLREMTILKADIAKLKDTNSAGILEEIRDIKKKLSDIKNARADVITRVPTAIKSVNNASRRTQNSLTSFGNARPAEVQDSADDVQTDAVSHVDSGDRSPMSPTPDMPAPLRAAAPDFIPTQLQFQPTETINTNEKSSYAQAVQRPAVKKTGAPIAEEGFKIVEKRKRRCRRNIRGTAAPETCKLKAATPMTSIYVSRLCKSSTHQDVLDHIRGRGESESVMEITKLGSEWRDTNFKAYRILVRSEKVKKFLMKDFWPQGVVFRRYIGSFGPTKCTTEDATRPTAALNPREPPKRTPAPIPTAAVSLRQKVVAVPNGYYFDHNKMKMRKL